MNCRGLKYMFVNFLSMYSLVDEMYQRRLLQKVLIVLIWAFKRSPKRKKNLIFANCQACSNPESQLKETMLRKKFAIPNG